MAGQDSGSALYIGDIGDNDREAQGDRDLPRPGARAWQPAGARATSGRTAQAEAFKLQYPDGARDAEGLLVHPTTGEILIVTKEVLGPRVYRVPLPLRRRERSGSSASPTSTWGAPASRSTRDDGRSQPTRGG